MAFQVCIVVQLFTTNIQLRKRLVDQFAASSWVLVESDYLCWDDSSQVFIRPGIKSITNAKWLFLTTFADGQVPRQAEWPSDNQYLEPTPSFLARDEPSAWHDYSFWYGGQHKKSWTPRPSGQGLGYCPTGTVT